MKVAADLNTTHNPCDEPCWASCLRENFTSSSYGEGLEPGRAFAEAPRQSLTRQTFHKILKSGCKAEDSKLRTAQRLVNLIAVFCILGWRVFWMTMLNRAAPTALPMLALTTVEIKLLDHVAKDRSKKPTTKDLSYYLRKIAKLGGYLDRASDPPPGNVVVERTISATDIELGFLIASENAGN